VNLYSAICPTIMFPEGELTVTELKEFATRLKSLVVAAVPVSIK
jgi:hypothetical protein